MTAEPSGIIDVVTILLVTIGPLKALIVYASPTAEADVDFRRQVAIRTVRSTGSGRSHRRLRHEGGSQNEWRQVLNPASIMSAWL